MKLQAYKATLPDDTDFIIKVSGKNKKHGFELASAKLRFRYPEVYHFIKLEYVGFVNV